MHKHRDTVGRKRYLETNRFIMNYLSGDTRVCSSRRNIDCIESTAGVADSGSHGENLQADFGCEGDEEDEEGGRGRKNPRARWPNVRRGTQYSLVLTADIDLISLKHQVQIVQFPNSVTSS